MYRAFTWAVLEKGIDLSDEKAVRDLVDTIDIRLEPQADLCRVYVGPTEVTEAIRTQRVSSHVSAVAALAVVPGKTVKLQQAMAKEGGVISTAAISGLSSCGANLKIFLTRLSIPGPAAVIWKSGQRWQRDV